MAAVSSMVIAGAALGYSVYSGERARSDAKKTKRKQEEELRKQESDLQKKRAGEDMIEKAEAARDAQAAKQGIRRRKMGGRRATLLANPNNKSGKSIGGATGKSATLIGG